MSDDTSITYSVGIDLGTTNCSLAYFDHTQEEPETSQVFEIPQVIEQNMVAPRSCLPSFIYLPPEAELRGGIYRLPWKAEPHSVVGEHARGRGEQTPLRLINSAKSWLSTQGEQHAKILPLAAPDDIEKISPVEASSQYLEHLKHAWDDAHPEAPLAEQGLIITVPASFDAVARDLTLEAARMAGLNGVILLEEPIAAFYAWLAENPQWRDQINVGDIVLVCDIGGGTTDFSLIAVDEEGGELRLSRIAVGNHLLLGGDNMDLALARVAQLQLEAEGKKLEQRQFFALAHSCRKAKEQLLSDSKWEEVPVVVPGRSSKLLGGTLQTRLKRKDLLSTLLEGFFSPCEINDHPQEVKRTGLRTIGLNYASDPSVLRHLAQFLSNSVRFITEENPLASALKGKSFIHPTAILFNGGVSQAEAFKQRVTEVLDRWLEAEHSPALKTLTPADPNLAVSLGAAYYGNVLRGSGIRIKSATAFSYYIGVESSMPAIPGLPPLLNALCVVPVGMEEGSSFEISEAEFGLVVGKTVEFRFFMSRERPEDPIGAIVEDAEHYLVALPSIETTLSSTAEKQVPGAALPVRLRIVLSEVGALELWCDTLDKSESWKLEFQLRGEALNSTQNG
ncbi:Hsp70 family protein [Deltaproteobacteria bacterium TL4]